MTDPHCPHCAAPIPLAVRERIRELEERIASVTEVYAGMEGFKPETAPEAYCLRVINQMYDAAQGR